jgi:hypothetical protein
MTTKTMMRMDLSDFLNIIDVWVWAAVDAAAAI